MSNLKLFLIGSLRHLTDDNRKESFKESSRAIGRAIVKSDFHVIVCSVSETTFDRFVLEGMNSVDGSHKVDLLVQENDHLAGPPEELLGFLRSMSNLDVTVRMVPGGWRATHLRGITMADLVIAVGGSQRGTGTVIYSAEALEKPVLAVPSFGGAAQEAWHDFRHYYKDDDIQILNKEISNASAMTFLIMGSAFAKRNPMKRKTAWPWSVLVPSMITLTACWIALYSIQPMSVIPYVIVLAIVSAALGLILQRSTQPHSVDGATIAGDVINAIGIGIALVLLAEGLSYLSGGDVLSAFKNADRADISIRFGGVALVAGFARSEFFTWLSRQSRSMLG